MPQVVKARMASPRTFRAANVRVVTLPESKMSSFIRRPIVPIISRTKALNLATSLMDISIKYLLVTIKPAIGFHLE